MHLRVKNLGPIRSAEVDLSKDFIVLVGQNNTGKTYFAWALYTLLGEALRVAWGAEFDGIIDSFFGTISHEKADELCNRLVQLNLAKVMPQLAQSFGVSRPTLGASSVELLGTAVSFPKSMVSRAANETPWTALETTEGITVAKREHFSQEAASESFAAVLSYLLHRQLVRNVVFFPAERAAISLFARELSSRRSALVDDALANEKPDQIIRTGAVLYPLTIRHALDRASRLVDAGDQIGEFQDLATLLESKLTGGTVSVGPNGELLFTSRSTAAQHAALGLHASASVVKSMASLVFYLRNDAVAGDLVVIDEPEINLHPDNQRRIARILAHMVNRGIRVVISTHSDYIVRELSNLVVLGAAGTRADPLVAELSYDKNWLLKPENVGVYLFHDNVADSVSVTSDGFEVKSIEDEIRRLDKETQIIVSGLLE